MADYGSTYDRLCPEGDGGNRQVVNQDEALILVATTHTPAVRAEGMPEPGRH